MKVSGELSFVEFGVDDAERGRAFYEGLFGWRFDPGPSGGFVIAGPNLSAGLHGGESGASPYVFFSVDDIEAAGERVRELGGTIDDVDLDGDDDSVMQFGHFKLCHDDQGSPFGLHQPPNA